MGVGTGAFMMLGRAAAGLAGSGLIAGYAYRRGSLSRSGCLGAILLGTLLATFGTIAWYGTLIVFFATSSALSKWRRREREAAESGYEKGGARDAGQVAANGGAALLFCLAGACWPSALWWPAYLGAVAAVTADTWATEIGGLSRRAPRSILTGRPVAAGTSGGVSAAGLLASAAGGLVIGLSAWLLSGQPFGFDGGQPSGGLLSICLVAGIGGVCGSLADSFLGATVQRTYRCPACGRIVERREHCGRQTERHRGWPFMNNDAVNVTASLAGAAAASVVAAIAGWM